jgi:hypothetical protein
MGWNMPGYTTSMSKVLRVYFALLSVEGLVAFALLLSFPRDLKNASFLGFSPLRLGLLGVTLSLIAVCVAFTIWIYTRFISLERLFSLMPWYVTWIFC